MLRYYLDNTSEIISLSEELKQIELYLDVLRQQYDDRLEYRVYCQEEVEKQKIPIVGLFPFVEQLVDFGVFSGHFRGTVYIDAEKKEEYCQIVLQLESSGLSMGHLEQILQIVILFRCRKWIPERDMQKNLVKILK